MNKSFWRGVLITFLIMSSACEYRVAGAVVWRGWVGWIADTLHALHGGEPHPGREEEER